MQVQVQIVDPGTIHHMFSGERSSSARSDAQALNTQLHSPTQRLTQHPYDGQTPTGSLWDDLWENITIDVTHPLCSLKLRKRLSNGMNLGVKYCFGRHPINSFYVFQVKQAKDEEGVHKGSWRKFEYCPQLGTLSVHSNTCNLFKEAFQLQLTAGYNFRNYAPFVSYRLYTKWTKLNLPRKVKWKPNNKVDSTLSWTADFSALNVTGDVGAGLPDSGPAAEVDYGHFYFAINKCDAVLRL
eukprot:TRINITY_DN57300_c0_g1_i1.p1 TRINITY_DN57300_c0_g1~~TRINITY_DN57300_c0_g1_i1.p1  ORF type:complete len:240 (-),score=6.92 TRINITY_DN57300_c0_g1_i1:177-896(-)